MKHSSASTGDNSSFMETATHFPCLLCSLGFLSSSDVKRHLAGHERNPTAHLAHLINAIGFKCRDCAAQFNSRHRRCVHLAEFYDEKLASKPQSQYDWSKLGGVTLMSMASALSCPGETKK
ncbi:hypothetical protein EG68_11823 [Paragonimus skrjabini miyazakii]|uniref:C2H2-type domain-containing protein n=1 Tax=Paragonimus skrjabini miyazakii TaxID=59628 RepID=A0A8S9YHP8_9TREM|nr:hypothetical protein EG68_11823 [Paragonimus skrjabini miyazakii]